MGLLASIGWNNVTGILGNVYNPSYIQSTFINAVSIFNPSISGGNIAIGIGNNIFKADSNGIYLGNSSYGSAPFRVDMTGAVTTSNVNITGGSITGAANINVSSNATIGKNLILSSTDFGAGVQWGNGVDPVQIYIDPLTKRLTLHATSVYANGFRLDQQQVAKFA
jgi:hypothetical protein